MAKEVLAVPILIENGFEWTNAGERDSTGRIWHTAGGSCTIPLPRLKAVEAVQRTLSPENGWTRDDEDGIFISLLKIVEHDEEVLVFFRLSPLDKSTIVTVMKTNRY
ncbi:MAG: hypothetical protein IH944_01395 [Armatimonadetes bacterium]|nr:hypothetical protein [Armatimonadota bacterium]